MGFILYGPAGQAVLLELRMQRAEASISKTLWKLIQGYRGLGLLIEQILHLSLTLELLQYIWV